MTSAELTLASGSAHSLDSMFAPSRVAIVGASDKSAWSRLVLTALERSSVEEIVLVNPRSPVVHGRNAVRSLTDAKPVDLAYVITPAAAILGVIEDAARAGVRNLVVLSSGFGEIGEEGRRLEEDMRAALARNGQAMLGPNTLGFVNFSSDSFVWPAGKGFRDVERGGVALITQSGALGGTLAGYAGANAIGLSLLCATGNEAGLTLNDIVDYAVDDPNTKVIALFVESIRDPEGLKGSARRAMRAGKPIVALKVGRSELAAKSAASHTGAIVGDDAVISVALAQEGVIRVDTLEELIGTAGVIANTGPIEVRGVALAAISGGVCDVAADECDRLGLPLAPFSVHTKKRLAELLPDYAAAHNPLDLTGAVVREPTLLGRVLETLAEDGGADVILCQENLGKHSAPTESIRNAAAAMRSARVPSFLLSATGEGLTETQQAHLHEGEIPHLPGGLDIVLGALSRLRWWSQRRAGIEREEPIPGGRALLVPPDAWGTWSEQRTGDFLAEHGIPVVPRLLARTRDEAEVAFLQLGGSVVVKVHSEDIAHKTEVGGVVLGLRDVDAVGDAFETVVTSARSHRPDATISGATISPMRASTMEIIVGVTTDPQWGKVLTIGAGGIWTEIMQDVSSRILPVGTHDVREMIDELRSAPLLRGARGAAPVDLDRLSETIARLGALALACGDRLVAIELNPVRVEGRDVEALDALAIWRDRP